MINEQKSSKKSYFFSNVALWYFKVQKNFAVNHLPLERGLAVQTWTSNRKPDGKGLVTWLLDIRGSRKMPKNLNPEAGESYFQYILLNEIQTMFSQVAKRSARVLPPDLCTDHAHYVKNHRSTVLRRDKSMAA